MKYERKTKDVFILIWNKEEIDTAETMVDAKYLQKEYAMAYKGCVSIKRTRTPK
jgi:hypothetical protein